MQWPTSTTTGFVSRDEATANVDLVFKQLDENADDALATAEYESCLVDVPGARRGPRERATSQERFAALDRDADGYITLDEYVSSGERAFRAIAGQERRAPAERYAASVAEGSGPADFNRDRLIGESEAATDITRTFAFLDVDRDGKVSPAEWGSIIEDARPALEFGAVDKDQSGALSRAELKAAAPWTQERDPVSVWRYPGGWLSRGGDQEQRG